MAFSFQIGAEEKDSIQSVLGGGVGGEGRNTGESQGGAVVRGLD